MLPPVSNWRYLTSLLQLFPPVLRPLSPKMLQLLSWRIWCSQGGKSSSVIVEGSAQGYIFICHFPFFNNYFSASGLSKHKTSCTGDTSTRSVSYSCPDCQKKFSLPRYLEQHKGSKACTQRMEYLNKTASFTLALSSSSVSEKATVSN